VDCQVRNQTVEEHFSELRHRLLASGALALAIFFFTFMVSDKMILFLINTDRLNLVVLSPTELISAMFNISLVFTFLVTLPFLMFQMIEFIKPAVELKMMRYMPYLVLGLFITGLGCGYWMSLMTSNFMIGLSDSIGISNMWSVSEYLNFTIITSLLFGLVFQIPLLMRLACKTGVVDYTFFSTKRKWVILILVATLAIISPQGDMLSLGIMATPMIGMYEIGILMARWWKC